ncbi:UNVERIFIED_CONTAM: hypothetical protein Slati_4601400 [Sesamum latifolium]|uniref:DUF4283 domain-containing protein n=1 Tax=Sesamum latifolium TaxID=2727402 RepID=A0AAW2S409_9LAMI
MDGDEVSLEKLVALKLRWERRFLEPAMVRRLVPRFSSKITFLPRRSIVQSTAGRVDIETQNLGNSQNSAEIGAQNWGNSQNSDDGVDIGTQNLEVVGNSQNSDVGNSLVRLPMGVITPAQDSQEVPTAAIDMGFSPVPEVFVGNVKLKMAKSDSIAEAFLNSSRKTLRYIPPTNQKEEIIVKPTPAMVAHGSRRWQSTAFKTLAFMEEVIEEGPWLFEGQPVVLQPWEQGMSLRRQKHIQVPVWIKIRHLLMEYWTEDGLSAVASGIGTPLYMDKITKNCLRLDFARVCVMLDYHSKLPKHLVVLSPILSESKESPIKVDIEYEWLPLRCKQCCYLGHTAIACLDTKVKK